jgi:hypothetical protein
VIPNSDGTADRPIVFGAYGVGPKPKFWGSDVLDKGGFQPEEDGIFKLAVGKVFHAVLIDHQFFRNARLVLKSDDPTANLAHVRSHPGSWFLGDGVLHLNTGVVDPCTYSAVVHEDLVSSNGKDNPAFLDRMVDETARLGLARGRANIRG